MAKQRQVEFASNQLPVLVSGKYTLSLKHTLSLESTGDSKEFSTGYAFQVQSERFTLNPSEF